MRNEDDGDENDSMKIAFLLLELPKEIGFKGDAIDKLSESIIPHFVEIDAFCCVRCAGEVGAVGTIFAEKKFQDKWKPKEGFVIGIVHLVCIDCLEIFGKEIEEILVKAADKKLSKDILSVVPLLKILH